MKISKFVRLYLICSVLSIFFYVNSAMGQSHDTAIPIGKSVKTQVNCGMSEPYDATITILEVVRGSDAWKLIKKADSSNKKPDKGYEYTMALISFKMKARGLPGDKTFDLDWPLQLSSFSGDFEEYTAPTVVTPEPVFKRTVRADEYAEGWIVRVVKKDDDRPLLLFDPASGGAWARGKMIFFKLYK
jgi:hypothetical protein